jgi:PAS domain S-box-containing protein
MKAVNMDISPELLRQAVTAANDALVIADARLPDKPLVYVNPAFERLTGYRPEEALGKHCCFLQGADTQQEGLVAIREALRTGASCETTVRSYRKDGTPFWNQLTLAPIVNRMAISPTTCARCRTSPRACRPSSSCSRSTASSSAPSACSRRSR